MLMYSIYFAVVIPCSLFVPFLSCLLLSPCGGLFLFLFCSYFYPYFYFNHIVREKSAG